ncbi:hypothetical protein PQR13_06455 [Paraburkholderia strydomiana]|uniref:hypothetical protein n=1 Tax=Paraburkholderia strydomiana TaxID=1245417 RepID=UPI0038B90DC9
MLAATTAWRAMQAMKLLSLFFGRADRAARLSSQGEDYVERSHREHSDPWSMEKDGKKYWGDAISSRHMRK